MAYRMGVEAFDAPVVKTVNRPLHFHQNLVMSEASKKKKKEKKIRWVCANCLFPGKCFERFAIFSLNSAIHYLYYLYNATLP